MSIATALFLTGKLTVFAALVAAAGWDVATRTIPNGVVLAAAGGGLVAAAGSAGRYPIWASILAAVLVLLGLRPLYRWGAIGGGDVKLISAVALGEPIDALFPVLVSIALAGGAIALFYLLRGWLRRRIRPAARVATAATIDPRCAWSDGGAAAAPPFERGLPYALAVLCGVAWHQLGTILTCSSGKFC